MQNVTHSDKSINLYYLSTVPRIKPKQLSPPLSAIYYQLHNYIDIVITQSTYYILFSNLKLYKMVLASKASGITYNKYLSLAAQAVRRCLKDDKRIIAEKRGEMNLRFAIWKDGRQGKVMNIAETSAAENSHEASP
ncbi:hypothetical protein GcC1_197029 [Golovinomyces cichoracearum]|uniref:Uncharacterized protein n=1 Tax=Golovinomyces cichoracearum TaxID=62708 RepID=A0A420HFW7_9PEZI|nr:hypothetical protein GcC1_197029 [Golovinomyces cichoracearum]